MTDGIGIVERVHKRGAFVKVLDREYLDPTKPINRGILALLSALAWPGSKWLKKLRPKLGNLSMANPLAPRP